MLIYIVQAFKGKYKSKKYGYTIYQRQRSDLKE